MIRFIHTADFHFGVENYGKIDQETGIHTRLLDFHRSLSCCIDKAIQEKVDFFLFCGDAYKTAHPNPTQQRLLFDCFLRLFKAQIPLVIVVGNHDNPNSFGKAHALDLFGQLPLAGFHVIAKPTHLVLETKNGPVQIVGIPWPTRSYLSLNKAQTLTPQELSAQISMRVAELIRIFSTQCNPSIPSILAGHLTVSTGLFSGSEKRAISGQDPCLLPSQLAISPFSYIALGHLHRHQQVNTDLTQPIVYPGSIERIDFGERKEEKGFCLVSIDEHRRARYEFINVPLRPFIQIETTLIGETQHTEQLLSEVKKATITDAVVKIIYHLPIGVKDRVDTRIIQQACISAHHLVGTFPIQQAPPRQARSALSVDMPLETALKTYLLSQKQPSDRIDRLAYLLQQLEQEQQEEEITPSPASLFQEPPVCLQGD